mgnify:FL=1
MRTIGLIGCGVVGTAVKEGMSHAFDVLCYDINGESNCDSVEEVVQKVDGPIFICVPSPMRSNGDCDISIVEGVVELINEEAKLQGAATTVAIKSTVVPGTTQALSEKYVHCNICFNPEFLTEANAVEDFKNQDRIIIGGSYEILDVVSQCYQKAYPKVPIWETSSTVAEMVKYTTNVHLAAKVGLANELNQICERLEIPYNRVIQLATIDKRLGGSHWSVPGPDGQRGFGGTCFPKDLNALINRAIELGVDPSIMTGAWKKNSEVRR